VEAKLAASFECCGGTLTQTLSLTFGSKAALASLRKTLADSKADAAARGEALEALVGVKDADYHPSSAICSVTPRCVDKPSWSPPSTTLPRQPPSSRSTARSTLFQKRDALNTLVFAPRLRQPLLTAVGENKVSVKDLTADVVRQLRP